MPQLSETATSILTLLNNVTELVVQSNDRTNAKEVMKAIKVYGKNKGFPLPEEKIDNFIYVLIDSRPYMLASLAKDIAVDVVISDRQKK